MKASFLALLVTVATMAGFAACGGSNDTTPATKADAAAGDDAGSGDDASGDDMMDAATPDTAPPLDHGAPSTTYPAFKPDMPQLLNNGGSVTTAPVFISVTWDTDPLQATLDDFTAKIAASPYWTSIVSEYGVGTPTVTNLHLPVDATHPLPAAMSDSNIGDYIDQNAGSPTSGWPDPTPNTIYVMYIHPGISFSYHGSPICNVVGGYHTATQSDVRYALVPRCGSGASALTNTTVTASHELGEAASDPSPNGAPAYFGFDLKHGAWYLFNDFQLENGDACEFYMDASFIETAPFTFSVQRMWSNKAAAAGHNPCVPAATGPYFTVVPTALEAVTVDLSAIRMSVATPTMGIKIPLGMTKTFPVGLISDAATSGPWSIRVAEGFAADPYYATGVHNLTVSIDKTSGLNGEIAYVTVTVNKTGTTIGPNHTPVNKGNYVTVLSSLGGATHYTPILISE